MNTLIKHYVQLAKPGSVLGNDLVALAGFLLAEPHSINWRLGLAMLVGLSLVMGSGCVFNNYMDREIDAKMERTKHRASVTGNIPGPAMLVYGIVLGIIGSIILAVYTNPLTTWITIFGWFAYVVLYGIGKRRTVHGTLIGSISGAIPPVVGYVAVTNHLDTVAWILFLIMAVWQMPHFYSIAIYRLKEYKAAGLPVLPAKQGILVTKYQIIIYTIAFIITTSLLTFLSYTGYIFLTVMTLLSLRWLMLELQGFQIKDNDAWARQIFRFSLVTLLVLCLMLSIGSRLA